MDTLSPEVLAAFNEYRVQKQIEKNAKERIEQLKEVIKPAFIDNILVDPVTGQLLMQLLVTKKEKFDKESFYKAHKALYEKYCDTTTEERFIIKSWS